MSRRLLMITERFAPDIGGLARSSARTAAALSRLPGAELAVDVLAWTRTLPPGAVQTVAGEEVAESARGLRIHRLGLFANWDLSLQHTLNVIEWLHREHRYECLWGHYLFPAGFVAVMFARLHGLRALVSARGNDIDRLMFPPGDFARLTWTLERADAITAVSRDLAHKIDVLLGRDARVVVVPNAVDLQVFCPGEAESELRAQLGVADGEVVLGFSGELRHKKGFPFMLSALSEVRRTHPACLLVIGEVRAREYTHLASYRARAPEDAARILVTGHLERPADVARHLRLCDLVLVPSVWDGLPNALLEAMACERIALCSDAGGMPEVVTHERDGFLIDKALLNRLGEAARDILELDADTRRAVEAAARRRIEAGFHARHEAEALALALTRAAGG